jgi:hypothetical protein
MSLEDNKKLAVRVIENLSNLKLEAVADALADDVRWWVLGATSGEGMNKDRLRKALRSMAIGLPNGLNLKISRVIGEGDDVVVEAEGNARTAGNKIYNNHYVWILTVRGGKVVQGREYMDPLHVMETFGPVLRPRNKTSEAK